MKNVHVMPMSHLDLFWLGEREECLSRGNRVISRAMAIAQEYPEFRFLLEDMVFVKHFLDTHPEKRQELARLVREGQIEVAPKYAGIYASLMPGEAHVRNLMYGKALAAHLLGANPQVAHQGDLPAHTPQYPQMLRKAGVPYVILCRLGPNQTPLFHWEALDGSRVLAWYSTNSYVWGWRVRLHERVEAAREHGLEEQAREIMGQTLGPILMHWGMDLILPTEKLVENLRQWNAESDISLRFSTPSEFFDCVKDTPGLPVIRGESPNGWGVRGSDGSPTDGRFMDFHSVGALLNAERFATISNLLGYMDYPGAALDAAWLLQLEAMDHNANGSGPEMGNRRHREYRRTALFTGEEILRRALRPIAENVQVPHGPDCTPLVVFNGLSWDRQDIATGHVSFHADISAFQRGQYQKIALVDAEGHRVPIQIIEDMDRTTREIRVVFPVEGVPSVGYKAYYVAPVEEVTEWPLTAQLVEDPAVPAARKRYAPLQLETDHFTFQVKRSGGQMSLYDKALQRWVIEGAAICGEETQSERNGLFEHYPTGRNLEFLAQSVDLAENGPVRARVCVRGTLGPMPVKQEWILYRAARRVDLCITTEGRGPLPVMLQQSFPTTISGGEVRFGVPYGTNSLDNIMPQLQPQLHNPDEANYDAWVNLREVQNWVDVSDGASGVTLATAHRMMEIKGGTLIAKLAFPNLPEEAAYETRSYHFQIHPHEGGWREARSYRWGWQLQTPLVTLSVNDPFTDKTLPTEKSFCRLSADHVVLTVLKRSQDGRRLVWRGYEAAGQSARMRLDFFKPLAAARETNLLETDESAVALDRVAVDPYEIITLAADPQDT
ncbi:MAG: hypothetical protein FJZ90_01295 [Chloroflexi bacterium]|nr:hypothetical protein [Chloroflexota bacterium]